MPDSDTIEDTTEPTDGRVEPPDEPCRKLARRIPEDRRIVRLTKRNPRRSRGRSSRSYARRTAATVNAPNRPTPYARRLHTELVKATGTIGRPDRPGIRRGTPRRPRRPDGRGRRPTRPQSRTWRPAGRSVTSGKGNADRRRSRSACSDCSKSGREPRARRRPTRQRGGTGRPPGNYDKCRRFPQGASISGKPR